MVVDDADAADLGVERGDAEGARRAPEVIDQAGVELDGVGFGADPQVGVADHVEHDAELRRGEGGVTARSDALREVA